MALGGPCRSAQPRGLIPDYFIICSNGTTIYRAGADRAKLDRVLQAYVDECSSPEAGSQLIFFRDAIEHVVRLARILRTPRGNAMLVGVGGSGKQSLARFATHVADYKLFRIEVRVVKFMLSFTL